MTLGNERILEIERGSIGSLFGELSLEGAMELV
jgi:hypothetical protein